MTAKNLPQSAQSINDYRKSPIPALGNRRFFMRPKYIHKNANTTAPTPRAIEKPFIALLSQGPTSFSANGRKR